MARYIQRISLRPYQEKEIYQGWDLEGLEGEVEGLILADHLSEEELARYGVTEFAAVPAAYVEAGEFVRKSPR